MPLFESYDRRIKQIDAVLNSYGIASVEEAKQICDDKGVDVYNVVKDTQPIAFENAMWAYIVGAAIAIKKGQTEASEIAATLGEGLQAFCIPGSVADDRKVGIGHGNLAAMLLREETKCFALLAGHESFAAAEGAIKIANFAISEMTIKENILEDDRYQYLFSVEDVNRLVQEGTPFRDAYIQIGKQIQQGEYTPTKQVAHTHAGSIGNLCLPEIQQKMEQIINSFNFKKMDLAIKKLLK